MRKVVIMCFVLIFSFTLQVFTVSAVRVNGYYRSNGTYVNSYERTAPDGNPYNNYSYPGNYNPNTGSITGGNVSTYLDNYYNKSSGNTYSPSSYNPSLYSYPTTPTCPLNSYYDGISSCKCNYGYSVSGNNCVSNDSLCHDQIGYSSSYDSISGNCKCDYGYIIGTSGQCVNANIYCSNQLGLMSQYNTYSKKCECMSGYEYNGSNCVYKTVNYSGSSASMYNNCPLNSHVSTTDSTKCECNSGYQVDSAKKSCVIIIGNTNNQVCTSHYGINSYWNGTKDSNGRIICGCQNGYNWNSSKTSCVINSNSYTESTPSTQNNDTIGKNYYTTNRSCVGLLGDQYGACINYAWNH